MFVEKDKLLPSLEDSVSQASLRLENRPLEDSLITDCLNAEEGQVLVAFDNQFQHSAGLAISHAS